ncbi:MAG TPA: hypothetical protein VIY48_01905 [Candidatus Paceibacterota bacterium]
MSHKNFSVTIHTANQLTNKPTYPHQPANFSIGYVLGWSGVRLACVRLAGAGWSGWRLALAGRRRPAGAGWLASRQPSMT